MSAVPPPSTHEQSSALAILEHSYYDPTPRPIPGHVQEVTDMINQLLTTGKPNVVVVRPFVKKFPLIKCSRPSETSPDTEFKIDLLGENLLDVAYNFSCELVEVITPNAPEDNWTILLDRVCLVRPGNPHASINITKFTQENPLLPWCLTKNNSFVLRLKKTPRNIREYFLKISFVGGVISNNTRTLLLNKLYG